MKMSIGRGVALFTVLSVAGAGPVAAQQKRPRAVLMVPAAGTFAGGGEFKGTISINRFERRGNDIVAIGLVAGVLSAGSQPVGTAVAGEVAWPVRVSAGGVAVANGRGSAGARMIRAAWIPEPAPPAALLRAQAETCPVLNVALAPVNVDLLGVQVALSGVTLDLAGVVGTPLGDLVCAASDLLGNVAGLVNVLNAILGLVTGLLGGLTGAPAGVIPVQ